MPVARRTVRIAAAIGALALGGALVACSAPAPSKCPAGLVDTANAKASDNGLDLTFSPAAIADFQPSALQSWVHSACVIAFTGDLGTGTATGHFAFTTEDIDEPAFALAVSQLGYDGSDGNWVLQESETEADVITANAASAGGGAIVDLSEAFPEAKLVIASFHFTGS